MKYLFYILAIILLLGVNVGLFNNLQIRGVIPNLPLLLVLYFAQEKKDYDFFFIALAGGIFLDCYSAGMFGGFTLAFLVVALLLNFLAGSFMVLEMNWKSLSFLLFAAMVVMDLILWLYGLIAFKLGLFPYYDTLKVFFAAFLPAFIYNWILLYPTYKFYDFLKNFIQNFTVRRRGVIR